MVYHEELQCGCTQVKYWILPASEVALCCHCHHDVRVLELNARDKKTNIPCRVLYAVELGISVHSCFITKEEKEKVLDLREEKRIEKEFEEEVLKSPSMIPMSAPGMIPRTPGFPPIAASPTVRHGAPISPFTPRHLAFNRLGSGSTSSDLPLRDNSSMPTPQLPSQPQTIETQAPSQPMYFPPPPKKATKN